MHLSPLSFVFSPRSATGSDKAPVAVSAPRQQQPLPLSLPRARATVATSPAEPRGTPLGQISPIVEDFVIGGVAVAVSKMAAAPITRAKLLLQCQGSNAQAFAISGTQRFGGLIDVLRRVPSEQGSIRALWRGVTPDLLRYFPQQAITYSVYERARTALNVQHAETFAERLVANVGAGGAAGALVLLAVQPLDHARTKLALDVGAAGKRQFTGMFDCLGKTAGARGWLKHGVYNGLGVSVGGMVMYRGLHFGLYSSFRDTDAFADADFWAKFGLGYCVTMTATLLTYPLDTVRRRLMMDAGRAESESMYKGALHCARKLVTEEGVAAFYRGAGVNVLSGLCGALVLVFCDDAKFTYQEWKYALAGSQGYA